MSSPFETIGWEILAALARTLQGDSYARQWLSSHLSGEEKGDQFNLGSKATTLSDATGSSKTCFHVKYTLAVDP